MVHKLNIDFFKIFFKFGFLSVALKLCYCLKVVLPKNSSSVVLK